MLLAQILSSMTVMICMLIDNIMIGRNLGIDAMAAYELASPVLLIFAAIGTTLSAGVQVLSGKTMGRSDRKGTDECFSSAIVLALLIAGVGLAFVMFFTGPLCTLLGAGDPGPDNPVYDLTKSYLQGFIIGAPAFILAQISVPFLQMSGKRTILVTAVVSMTVADVVLDILNVTFFDGGMFGMGMASSISYYVALGIGLIAVFQKSFAFRFRFGNVRLKIFRKLLRYGLPTVVSQICFALLTYSINNILQSVDQNLGVAAYSVVSAVGNICFSVGNGVGAVAMMLASMFYSDEDRSSITQTVRTMIFYAVLINAAITVLLILVARPIAKLFLADQRSVEFTNSIVDLTAWGVRIFSFCLVPCSLNTAFRHFYQGVNRRPLTNLVSVMQNLVFTAIFALVFSRFFGTTGVWFSFLGGETMTLIVLSAIVFFKNGRRLTPEAYAMMPEGFGVCPEDCLELTVKNSADATRASEKAAAFCRSHRMDDASCRTVSQCIGEISKNILTYGFKADEKEHSIDVRIWIKDGKKVVRIRDNCTAFDPVRYGELHRNEHSKSHTGIRTVMDLVTDARYVYALGLNNLTLTL